MLSFPLLATIDWTALLETFLDKYTVVLSFGALGLLLALGKWLRVRCRFLQQLYIPASILAGIIGLIIIQIGGDALPPAFTAGWRKLPGLLINIVFATLFLGVAIPPLATVWKRSAPQLAYGQIVAWGQYSVGLGLVLVLLRPLFGTTGLFGVIVPVGFEGGHGTAGGLTETFTDLGWADGTDFALASATAGIVSAIVVGMALVNWAVRKGVVKHVQRVSDMDPMAMAGLYSPDKQPSAGKQTVNPGSIDVLALHLAFVAIAILIGAFIKGLLLAGETGLMHLLDKDIEVMRAFPLFPLCMIGGLLVQLATSRRATYKPIDHTLMQRIGGAALDFLVVAAIATIRIDVVAKSFWPFIIIVIGGIIWNVFCVMVVAKRMLPNCWFERAIAEMGQSMGVTATGLLLLRAVDPDGRTEATSAFGYKQLLHEPFMGGGLWTASAVVLVATHGALPIFLISVSAIIIWLIVWKLIIRPTFPNATDPNDSVTQ